MGPASASENLATVRRRRGRSLRSRINSITWLLALPASLAAVLLYFSAANTVAFLTQSLARERAAENAAEIARILRDGTVVLGRIAQRAKVRELNANDCDPFFTGPMSFDAQSNRLVNLQGDVLCGAAFPTITTGENVFVRAFADTGELTVGVGSIFQAQGHWYSWLSYPVKRGDGTVGGFVVFPLDMGDLNKRLFPVPTESFASLAVDERGIARLASVGEALIGRAAPISAMAPGRGIFSRLLAWEPSVVSHEVFGTRWTVSVAYDPTSIATRIGRDVFSNIAFIAAVLLMMFAAGRAVSRRITQAMDALCDSIRTTPVDVAANPLQPSGIIELDYVGEYVHRVIGELADKTHLSQQALDAIESQACIIDDKGLIVGANRSWLQTGEAGGIAQHLWSDINYLDTLRRSAMSGDADAENAGRIIAEVLSGARSSGAFEYRCDVGSRQRYFIMRVSGFRFDGHARAIVIHTDITEQKMRESDLAALNSIFREVEQVARIGGRIVDGETNVVQRTPGWYKVWGVEPGDDAALIAIYMQPENAELRDAIERATQAAWQSATPWAFEYHIRNGRGAWRWYHFEGSPVVVDGKVVRLAGTIRDVTEYHAMQDRLLQSEKLESIGKLTAGMAHDFNNLLGVVTVNLEMLQDEPGLSKRAVGRIATSLSAVERGAGMTESLLAFARKNVLNNKPVDLRDETKKILELVKRSIPPSIALTVDLDPEPVISKVDAAQLATALVNIVLNARDAMPRGGAIALRVAREAHAIADDPVQMQHREAVGVISVTDTGQGIPADILPHVFDPFFTTKEVGKGTGLGLSMVYGFVRQSGGQVTIASEPGQGTTIRMLFPLSAEPPSEEAQSTPLALDVSGARILLVEDSHALREGIADYLTRSGAEVIEACDWASAVRGVEGEGPIDILITDIALPGRKDGFEIVAECFGRWPQLKVITMSGHQTVAPPNGIDGGVWIHLKKPFRRDQLAAALWRVAAGRTPA